MSVCFLVNSVGYIGAKTHTRIKLTTTTTATTITRTINNKNNINNRQLTTTT